MRIRPLVLLAVVATFGLVSAAVASVRINIGIDGIKPGQSQAQVKAIQGKPTKTIKGSNDFGSYTEFVYSATRLRVFFQGNSSVTSVETTGVADRTPTGVGVGSTEAQVKAGVKGERCESVDPNLRICTVGRLDIGRRVTTFRLRKGKVFEVSVGVVID